jgi:hypothetical protein
MLMMIVCSVELLCLRHQTWLFVQLNCCVCATDLLTVQLNCSLWTSLLTVCQLKFSVRATGLLNLGSVVLLPLHDDSVLWRSNTTAKFFYSKLHSPSFKHLFFNLDHCQNFPLNTIFCSSVSVYISHKFRYCKRSVYYPTWFLVLLAWTKTLSSQEAIRVVKCLHAG